MERFICRAHCAPLSSIYTWCCQTQHDMGKQGIKCNSKILTDAIDNHNVLPKYEKL
jgi:hypothetical protein